eukprot:TRINITY_DN7279_c0_g1_i1.p1 TRINITY_DN7279_c0_g1~~TRINITY_DN7279_c0_g1_i1.p1  ORF type:complete len:280 (+),score=66.39 TRINITY_DN7279_c0_g1_i1:1-840(+)
MIYMLICIYNKFSTTTQLFFYILYILSLFQQFRENIFFFFFKQIQLIFQIYLFLNFEFEHFNLYYLVKSVESLSISNFFYFFFFFNDTATTEIYTLHIVGSVRCVQETVSTQSTWGVQQKKKQINKMIQFYKQSLQLLKLNQISKKICQVAKLNHTLTRQFSNKTVKLTFINKDNSETQVEAEEGKSILEVAHSNNIDLEGACEGSLACSTCHVILEQKLYDNIQKPKQEEEDILDMAFGLTPTSRLGCQVKVQSGLFENTKIRLPKATKNFSLDKKKH